MTAIRTLVLALATTLMAMTASAGGADPGDAEVRPFRARISESAVNNLRKRAMATRWPDAETVADASQGAQLARMQELVWYWATGYDWRKAEKKLNALPQFITRIDGVDIHFIHVRSKQPNALPMIITHGWPGSVFEQIKLIGPLTDPASHGGQAQDAFDVVIPSVPGFGFSSRPTEVGWNADRIARTWDVLMKRLGYTHYVAQGGDWGAAIVQAMGRQAPAGLAGIHTNLPATITDDLAKALGGGPLPADATGKELAALKSLIAFRAGGNLAYVQMMRARPQAVGYGLTDSPAGLAGWMLVHPGFEHWQFGDDPRQSPTRDDVLDDFSLYWLTNSSISSARIYWEHRGTEIILSSSQKTADIKVPVAISVFPQEVYQPQESWARRAYPTLIYFNEASRGGHFAAWEYPEDFSVELRAAFRSLR
jgi:pimeloyl-ACP methyl ester carboxylesterase